MNRKSLIIFPVALIAALAWYGLSGTNGPEAPAEAPPRAEERAAEEDHGDASGNEPVFAPAEEAAAPDIVIELSGTNFAFSEKEIRVKEGQTVKVVFTSAQGFHDWVVNEFNAATEKVRDGGVTEVTFVADKKGEYEYYCSVGAHRQMGMVGKLIVE